MSELLKFPRLLILILLFSLSIVAAVSFTPAYPLLVSDFHLSNVEVQWMMTLYLLGSVLGRLPYGPLANAIGRKKTLYLGLWLSLIGTLIVLIAPVYSIIIIGRCIQAIGCAAGTVVIYTMIGDCHVGPKATKALSYVMTAYAILPGLGTSISGYLTKFMSWRGSFLFLLLFTILLLFSCLALPETKKERDLHSLKLKRIIHTYKKGFKNPSLIFHGFLMGLSTALLFIFAQQAPFIATAFFNMTPLQYGLYYLVPSFGVTVGCFLTAWLAGRVDARKSMIAGIFLIVVGILLMGIFFTNQWYAGWTLFLPQIAVQIGDALLYTNALSEALSETDDKAHASSIVLFINGAISAAGTFFVGIFAPKTPMSIPAIFLILIALMLFIWLLLGRHHRRSTKII